MKVLSYSFDKPVSSEQECSWAANFGLNIITAPKHSNPPSEGAPVWRALGHAWAMGAPKVGHRAEKLINNMLFNDFVVQGPAKGGKLNVFQ